MQRLNGGRSQRTDSVTQVRSSVGNVKAAVNKNLVPFYYFLATYMHFDYRFMKVTDLICQVKRTEVNKTASWD